MGSLPRIWTVIRVKGRTVHLELPLGVSISVLQLTFAQTLIDALLKLAADYLLRRLFMQVLVLQPRLSQCSLNNSGRQGILP